MVDQPCKVDEKGHQDKVQHEGKPEGSDPGNDTGKTARVSPFHDAGQDKRGGNEPESCNIPWAPAGDCRNCLESPDENITVYKSVYGQDDGEKDYEGAGFQFFFGYL